MHIEIDTKSGFCYGVVKTIKLAEDALANGKPVYCLGDIVHNDEEVKRLKLKGLTIINHEQLQSISNANVMIRAHGEPSSTYNLLNKNSNTLTEGTCPIVLKLQKKVRAAWEELKDKQGTIIIYGKKGHAEVIGLMGQTDGNAIIVDDIADLQDVDFSKPIALFSQTTQQPEGYTEITNAIKLKMLSHIAEGEIPLKITNSICGHVSQRGEHLAEFVKNYEIIIFVSGAKSSNGKILLDICRKNNSNTHWVANAEELHNEWFTNVNTVGICGATSTPQWLMVDISQKIKSFDKNN